MAELVRDRTDKRLLQRPQSWGERLTARPRMQGARAATTVALSTGVHIAGVRFDESEMAEASTSPERLHDRLLGARRRRDSGFKRRWRHNRRPRQSQIGEVPRPLASPLSMCRYPMRRRFRSARECVLLRARRCKKCYIRSDEAHLARIGR